MDGDRLGRAIDAIDAANADDPTTITVAGARRPKELAHAEMVTAWVHRLRPDAPEALLLAARAHHIRRWESPRSTYPEGRAGYLRWRRALHEQHASEVAEILAAVGYDHATIERVQDLVRKRGLGRDPEVSLRREGVRVVQERTHDPKGGVMAALSHERIEEGSGCRPAERVDPFMPSS